MVQVHGLDKTPSSATSEQEEKGADSNHNYMQSNYRFDCLILGHHLCLLVQKVTGSDFSAAEKMDAFSKKDDLSGYALLPLMVMYNSLTCKSKPSGWKSSGGDPCGDSN
ncbi:uncharacterized protein LOC121051816 isoform X2 [Rosa chinensis]|uniref:uncharacterized protein LOC121051816 isoform X2 n=1 Tax=Rosa chinensis TaxID=74649 RepID=UPI001AD8A7FC|nr:uncharacterized protein LOC121051816 isoform X2 [Rosa chinensis]